MGALTNIFIFFMLLASFIGIAFCIRYFATEFAKGMLHRNPIVVPKAAIEKLIGEAKNGAKMAAEQKYTYSACTEYIWYVGQNEYFISLDWKITADSDEGYLGEFELEEPFVSINGDQTKNYVFDIDKVYEAINIEIKYLNEQIEAWSME